ncbi:hypothetical protein F5Y13DRAFT_149117 [Hypoxylon sp. FL1857]|nr:hypothetical protein F5Y13DRAFT_149117 [Hypoxylon sp. FL1857]
MGNKQSKPNKGKGRATVQRSFDKPHSDRSIFVVSWGRNGQSSWSFHKCILITDSVVKRVSRGTAGTHYDWGSMIGNVRVTENPPVQIKKFTPAMFDKGVRYRNSYEFKGITNWSDEKIKQFFGGVGDSYSVALNNCRDVAESVARTLARKTETASVARALDDDWDIRQQRTRFMTPMIIGVPAFPMGAYVRSRAEENKRASGNRRRS